MMSSGSGDEGVEHVERLKEVVASKIFPGNKIAYVVVRGGVPPTGKSSTPERRPSDEGSPSIARQTSGVMRQSSRASGLGQ